MQNALMIDPRYSAFFGPQDAGSGSGTFGNGNGAGWMQGLANLPGSEAYYTAAQGNGDSAFGIGLTNDVSVQLVNDFSRGHLGHGGIPVSGAGRAHPFENGLLGWLI